MENSKIEEFVQVLSLKLEKIIQANSDELPTIVPEFLFLVQILREEHGDKFFSTFKSLLDLNFLASPSNENLISLKK